MCMEAALNVTEWDKVLRFPPTPPLSELRLISAYSKEDKSPSTLSPLSKQEAEFYYRGLSSSPVLVARTSTAPFTVPKGFDAYGKRKELRPVGDHPLKEVWEDNLARKVYTYLDSKKVQWTSIDVVRIGEVEDPIPPVILWIGIKPASLSGYEGLYVAFKCKEFLIEHRITDVEVEIRESEVIRYAGPKFLTPTHSFNPTANAREPLTTALGLPICAKSTPWTEATGGFFVTEGENNRRLLITTRHTLFPADDNKHFDRKTKRGRRHDVALFGYVAFNNYIESVLTEIGRNMFHVELHERRVKAMEGKDSASANRERLGAQRDLDEANEAIEELSKFYKNTLCDWTVLGNRVLGHVILSPPISVSSEGYTEDWAIIEVNTSKIDADNFDGNIIDLGTRIAAGVMIKMMGHSFCYPYDRLLRLEGTIPDEEMRCHENNEPCLMVLKRGNATGLTIGRANNIISYTRQGEGDISKEWAILPFDSKSGAFAAKGDSGSVVVDGRGRIGGLLTGGAGLTCSDITYATPITFLLKRLAEHGLENVAL
ncbi:hypothetical protein VNI00_014297 [Paramarasmius palmivorus]|uniref:Uncharacterized protein n=1 Tax=Paramarasmius palmivorus TaxID=297713 RepID=A0AAW0BYK6_9AGAR